MYIFFARKIALTISALTLAAAATTVSADEMPSLYLNSSELKIVEQFSPDYPRIADRAGVDGYVVLEFTVAPDGSVVTPAVTEASSGRFTQSALDAISRWHFEPVLDNGVAVPVRSNMKFSFVPRPQ